MSGDPRFEWDAAGRQEVGGATRHRWGKEQHQHHTDASPNPGL